MFDKLEDLLVRFEEVLNELGEPGVTDNQERFQKLMKEQSELQPIVDAYKEYKDNKRKRFRTVFPCWKKKRMKKCVKC